MKRRDRNKIEKAGSVKVIEETYTDSIVQITAENIRLTNAVLNLLRDIHGEEGLKERFVSYMEQMPAPSDDQLSHFLRQIDKQIDYRQGKKALSYKEVQL